MAELISDYRKKLTEFCSLREDYRRLIAAGKSIESIKMKQLKEKIDALDKKLKAADSAIGMFRGASSNYQGTINV